jgi:hypothetical protein
MGAAPPSVGAGPCQLHGEVVHAGLAARVGELVVAVARVVDAVTGPQEVRGPIDRELKRAALHREILSGAGGVKTPVSTPGAIVVRISSSSTPGSTGERILRSHPEEGRWDEAADPQLDVVAYSAPLRAHALMGATRRGPAMEYVGIDLHKKESQICLLTEAGKVMERRIRTEPERFAEVLGGRPRARILVEASTESEWVARCLEAPT